MAGQVFAIFQRVLATVALSTSDEAFRHTFLELWGASRLVEVDVRSHGELSAPSGFPGPRGPDLGWRGPRPSPALGYSARCACGVGAIDSMG